jgi:hypothetical protein
LLLQVAVVAVEMAVVAVLVGTELLLVHLVVILLLNPV